MGVFCLSRSAENGQKRSLTKGRFSDITVVGPEVNSHTRLCPIMTPSRCQASLSRSWLTSLPEDQVDLLQLSEVCMILH